MIRLEPCGALRALPLLLALGACASDPEPQSSAVYAQDSALSATPDLSRGQRRTLCDGIPAAENQLFTSTGRLFISGDEGVYEITQQGAGHSSHKLQAEASCQFGGLTEHAGTLYANCYDMVNANSSLYAAPLTQAPALRVIHALPGVALANGLTSDEDGNLYVASTFDGTILRLQLEPGDPLKVRAQDTFIASSGLFSNGIKYFDGRLYWTAFTTLKNATLRPDGQAGLQRDLWADLTFLDDLYADESGFLLDDYLNGKVIGLNAAAQQHSATPNNTFDGPSSVEPAQGRLGLSAGALVVTERGGNRVSVYEP